MAATFLNKSPATLDLDKSKSRVSDPNRRNAYSQLLFNAAVPANAFNRATQVGPPAPIVIEKLLPRVEKPDDLESTGSSLCFSALSEERLLAAVRLAKRDLRRRRKESLNCSPVRSKSGETTLCKRIAEQETKTQKGVSKGRSKTPGPKEDVTLSGAKVLVYTPQKYISIPPGLDHGLSPPTRDPGPRQTISQEPKTALSQEVLRLQIALANYIQKIEQLTNRGQTVDEPLEPDVQDRLEVRRQEQASRSARVIYVLQQQVKEIQEDLDKLRSNKIQHTKKSRAMSRLAAAHRGAVRAMQAFTNQLSDPSEYRVHSHYKELGQLIRQLSLCSAKVAVDQGSAVPETALDILQNLETLDNVLREQERPARGRQARAHSSSPPRHRRSPQHNTSPAFRRAPKGPATRGLSGPRRAASLRKPFPAHRRVVRQYREAPSAPRPHPQLGRSQVLRAGLESLVPLREHGAGAGQVPNSQGGAQQPDRTKKQGAHLRDAGFQQPTVASRLRVCQLPQKEASVPWIPTSPHSPPKQQQQQQQQRSPQKGPEPRCLFSPLKPSSGPSEQQPSREVPADPDLHPTSDRLRQAHNEALRQAWLDKVTMQRLKEMNQLSKEEADRVQSLRSEVDSPTQRAERAEWARGRLLPLLDQVQHVGAAASPDRDRKAAWTALRRQLSEKPAGTASEGAEVLSPAPLEELLDEAALSAWAVEAGRLTEGLARAPTLESMLLRMEEIEKDQEAVRRRFAAITYSDPRHWDGGDAAGPRQSSPGSRPVSPQHIKIHRPAQRHITAADIVLQSPVETGHSVLSDSRLVEDTPIQPQPCGGERGGPRIRLSMPTSMQRNLEKYKQEHEAYLRLVAHEVVGSFNPWAVADSLADELMSEALDDVAAEFQDVCEDYAEAVFTSEFLQPITSSSPSIPLDSQ
ncbi:protein moonraker isoform X1 [Esox lucius]|uniref:Protein moonraker n=1 Tax=Esox lucius TaxID=8010 RepID=A0A3P8Z1M7_ESOLU|nr:protein moonraker isoform X1 [Esox lucius]